MSPESDVCSCEMLRLTRTLSQSEVLVVSTSRCGLDHLWGCGSRLSMPHPVQLAGVLVSGREVSLRWVVGHQAVLTWHRVQTAHSSDTRAAVYRGLIQEIREAENSLFFKELNHGLQLNTITQDQLHYRLHTKMMKKAKKPKYKSSEVLENRRILPAKKSDKRLTFQEKEENRAMEILSKKRLNKLDPPTEQELLQTLDAELSDMRAVRNLTHSFVKRGASWTSSLHGSMASKEGRLRRLRRRSKNRVTGGRKKVKNTEQKRLYVVPYCLYAGGDFHDLHDRLKVSRALEQDRAEAKMRESIKQSRLETSRVDPRQMMDLALVDLPPGIADVIADSQGLSEQSADVVKSVRIPEPIVAVAAAPGPVVVVARTTWAPVRKTILPVAKSPIISERERHDHRVKSFIIFFVAIFGILVVMASLLILAMKEKNTPNRLEPYPRVRRSKILAKESLEQQQREDETRDVIQGYPDMEVENLKFSWPQYIAQNLPEVVTSVDSQTDGPEMIQDEGQASPGAVTSSLSVGSPRSPKPSPRDYLGGGQVVLDLNEDFLV